MFLGVDLGSSSIKLSLLDGDSGKVIASVTHPKMEMKIQSPKAGWAEQDPELWWHYFLAGYRELVNKSEIDSKKIRAIGIAYQMHGLVIVDKDHQVLRPSIIWCDSRAVQVGDEALNSLGAEYALGRLLNSPGNFTASKLSWVRQNEPEVFSKVHKFMLPGDFLAMKLSRQITTTRAGLSEGVFWDFEERGVSKKLLESLGLSEAMIPDIVPEMGADVQISTKVAEELGLSEDVVISYRSGDQPNNAFSLNVLEPDEVASTAGTSGVIYAVTDKNVWDQKSRINTFLHVNDTEEHPRNGVLICVNGTGILYSWMRKVLNSGGGEIDFDQMNEMVQSVAPGASGVQCLPFGNGAERIFENKMVGAHLLNLDFNRHNTSHMLRASVEGIVFALNLGFEMLTDLEVGSKTIRAGRANLFLSEAFREIFVNVTGLPLELYDTDGAAGAARGAALGVEFYGTAEEAFSSLEKLEVIEPDPELTGIYSTLFSEWNSVIQKYIN